MEGNIVGEPIEDFVGKQINIRQQNQFSGYNSLRNDNQLKYLNNRNAWIKLASSVEIGIDSLGDSAVSPKLDNIGLDFSYAGTKLAEAAILFNTLSSYTNSTSPLNSTRANISNTNTLWNNTFAYGIGGTEFGIQPPPGIVSAQVDSLNRGSIRKANVVLKAHNRFQFDLIELLYLKLGFTMMLEWGWDKYLDDNGTLQQTGNTIIEEKWFTSSGISQLEMLDEIQKLRKKYQGNVDGFFGKVSNFTWSFNPDGTYDITIDLITLGDVIESIKVNTVAKQKLNEYTPFENEPKTITELERIFSSDIIKAATLNSLGAFLFNKIDTLINQQNQPIVNLQGGKGISVDYIYLRPQTPKKVDPIYDSSRLFYYVRLGELLKVLQNFILPQVQNGKSTSPQVYISSDESLNKISYFPNQIPLDPRVCIFRVNDGLNAYGDITGIANPPQLENVGSFSLNPYIQTSGDVICGSLMNLYMNIEFISGLLVSNGGPDQELSLFKFLQDLCNGINSALGGVNKLEPVIKNDSTIVIIDQTLSVSVKDIVDLEVYGYNTKNNTSNFVKDVKFVSKITPQLASMVSIGATAAGSNTAETDGTAFSKWSDGLVDRFANQVLEPKLPISSSTDSADRQKYENEFKNFPDASPSVITNLYKALGITDELSIKKRVTDPYYEDLLGSPMDLESFIIAASEFEINQKLKGVFRPGDISNLVDKNYGFYLANAFGGTVSNILIVDTVNYNPRDPSSATKVETSPNISPSLSRYFEFNDTFIAQGKAVYKNYINSLNNKRFNATSIPSSEIGFIPLSFDLVLDGISGIKIYNKLSINSEFLPSNYPESLRFVITKVNHNISNNNWETSLSTISMPETKPYEYGTFPPSTETRNTENQNTSNNTTTGGDFDPGNLFTSNGRTTNAWKLISDPTIPVENGFLHRYPDMLVEADTNLYKRLNMQNNSDNKKFRLFYPAMPYFINLLDAYEKAVSTDGQTFLQKYGKLTITSAYRAIQNTPGGGAAAAPGTSRHGLGLAIDLQQPASHAEVYNWFKVNAPGLGWMRIPLLSNGVNETWHWELQYEGPYAKIDKNVYGITSNIKNSGRNGIVQYKSSKFKEAKGVNNLNPKYLIDTTGKVWGKQIIAQTLAII